MRRKRGYKRETPSELVRDYKLFAIACEGGKREPEYFKVFQYLSSRIKVDIVEEKIGDEALLHKFETKSAPKWVLERVMTYIDKEGLIDEDDLWIVMDVDRWESEQIREIASYCDRYPNWHIVLSNPCFEVWLYFHKKSDIESSKSNTCSDFKTEISGLERGGYHPLKFIPLLLDAISNCGNADNNKDYYMPQLKRSKVYQLGEAIVQVIGQNGFNEFIRHVLPKLNKEEVDRIKSSKKKRK